MPKPRPPASVTASLMTNTVVSAAPTSTTKITGFFATCIGLSFTKESLVARPRISASNSGRVRVPLDMSCWPSVFVSCLGSRGGAVSVDIVNSLFVMTSERPSVQHLKVFDNRTKRKCREIRQRTDDDDGPDQEDDKQ